MLNDAINPEELHRRHEMADNLRQPAEEAAAQVLGTDIGAEVVAGDVRREMLLQGTRSLLDMLQGLGDSAATFVWTDADNKDHPHRLINLFEIKRAQRKEAKRIIEEAMTKVGSNSGGAKTTAGRIGQGAVDIGKIMVAMTDLDLDSPLFAQLYVPVGVKYDQALASDAAYIARFDDMEFGQQIGALYRFFSSSVAWLPDGIQNFLKRLMQGNLH